MTIVAVIALLLTLMLILQSSRRTQDVAKSSRLRRLGLFLAVAASVLALIGAFKTGFDRSDEQVPTLTGDRLP